MRPEVAARTLRRIDGGRKNRALALTAAGLMDRREEIMAANRKDLLGARDAGLSPAMIERLTLTDSVIRGMVQGLKDVEHLPDPVGRVTGMWTRPNGLSVGKVRIPLGVIGFIYESRPNVTVDAAALCLKSGNAVLLKGGSEALESNLVLESVLGEALDASGLPRKAVQVIPTTDREAVTALVRLDEYVDLIIPRGGEGLIRFVSEHSRVPVLKHYKGGVPRLRG